MALERLDDILDGLLHLEADRVTLEWTSDGLEVMMCRGTSGVGGVVERPVAGAIIEELVTRANLENRSKGFLKARLRDRLRRFVVNEYDHFGESAFEIKLRT